MEVEKLCAFELTERAAIVYRFGARLASRGFLTCARKRPARRLDWWESRADVRELPLEGSPTSIRDCAWRWGFPDSRGNIRRVELLIKRVQTPIEITLRDVPSTPAMQNFLRQQANRLERFCENLTSCRIAIERPHRRQQSGNPYRVRIEVTLPPRKDLVVVQDPEDNEKHTGLRAVVRHAFRALERQLKDITDLRRGDVKTHAEPRALVVRLFEDYGFLKSLDGREIYFHRNAVLHGDFDDLEVGSEVRFEDSVGEEGPQATTVQLVNRLGAQTSNDGTKRLPPGWK